MKENNFHDVITNYFSALGESFNSPASSYDQRYILNHINEFIDNDFFTFHFSTLTYSSHDTLPVMFIMEVKDGKYIIIKNQGGKCTNLTTNTKITPALLESKNLFFFRSVAKALGEDSIYQSLIKLTPKSTLYSLPLVLFALLLPLYSNLFNSRLVYSESIASLLYISVIFLFIVGLEFFSKHIIYEHSLKKIKVNIGIFNRYFASILKQSNCKNAAIKIRTAEASIMQVWEIKPQIIYDIGLAVLFALCIIGMLGFYSVLLLLYYTGLIFLCLHVRFSAYKNMLRANSCNYEKSAMYYSLEQKKQELAFINEMHFKQYIDSKINEDEKVKLKINEANHHWVEVIKANSFLSMVVMYIACYLAVGSGSLSLASIIAVLIINGRLSGAITGAINRLFMIKTHLFHIKSSVSQLTQNLFFHSSDHGILIDHVEQVKIHKLTINFNGKKVINELNFDAKPGDIIGITGVSGSGKTSLINALNGTNDHYAGEITINDVKLSEISGQFFQEKVTYHSGASIFLSGSIRDNFNLHGVFDNALIIRITKLCCPKLTLSKENLGDTLVSDLQASTGEKQKLMLAISLLKKPEIIFLDESTSFMASRDALTFLTTLRQELELENAILFFSTHDLGLMPLFTQHIALSAPPPITYLHQPSCNSQITIPRITLSKKMPSK